MLDMQPASGFKALEVSLRLGWAAIAASPRCMALHCSNLLHGLALSKPYTKAAMCAYSDSNSLQYSLNGRGMLNAQSL